MIRQPRYSKEEFARRGNKIYETQVRSQVKTGNYGKIVAMIAALSNLPNDAIEGWLDVANSRNVVDSSDRVVEIAL